MLQCCFQKKKKVVIMRDRQNYLNKTDTDRQAVLPLFFCYQFALLDLICLVF